MKRFVFPVLFIYLGLGVYLYLEQRSFIYFPVQSHSQASDLQQLVFDNDGYQIKTSVLNEGNKKAIIYFGGNAENVDYNAERFKKMFPEYAIYLFKYRGYAGSGGEPSEKAIYADALRLYDLLQKKHEEIALIGRSLGSAVATYVAAKKEVKKLVLVTPFDSVLNVAQKQYPIYPIGLMLKDRHDSLSRVKQIRARTLVVAAENDTIIDMSHTKNLVKAFSLPVDFHIIEDANHNNIANFERYNALLINFM